MRKIMVLVMLMLTICTSVFAASAVKSPKTKGLVPMPMAIGAKDEGGWIYLGRFIAPANFKTFTEWETKMKRYTDSAEANNLQDVYYYHSHYGDGDGEGCYNTGGGEFLRFYCVIKCVPLDRNARPLKISGVEDGIFLLSMKGESKGIYSTYVQRIRVFDSVTHQLLEDLKPPIVQDASDQELYRFRKNSPYYIARGMSTDCPVKHRNF